MANIQNDSSTIDQRRKQFLTIPSIWEGRIGRVEYKFNPVTTICSTILVFAVVAWILADPNSQNHADSAKLWITENFTWLYIAAEMSWIICIVIIFVKFGDIKLGTTSDKPEHDNFSYFCMILTCGMSTPIFYGGVSEPLTHYNKAAATIDFYDKDTSISRAQNAINLTFYLWGLHGFASYTVLALIIGVLTHRKGLPITLRTCFYPLLGRKIFGPLGDFIDTLSITSIIYGVSVSLVMGTKVLNSGFNYWNDNIEIGTQNQTIILWGLTLMSTISVILGLEMGIKRLAQSCFVCSAFLWLIIVMSYNTSHIFNVLVQSVGYYLQHLFGMGLYTGAFEQQGFGTHDTETLDLKAKKDWMHENTIFYWGWWIVWSPFVSLFVVKLSKGRTIREVIIYTLFLPTISLFLWLTAYMTIAIDMETDAIRYNITCDRFNSSSQTNIHLTELRNKDSAKYDKVDRLSCYSSYLQLYHLFRIFGDAAHFLRALSVIGSILFFVTSSDSASLIVDTIASNGEQKPPVVQRVFWALVEGVVGTSLIKYSEENSAAIKAITVICGLPLVFVLSFCCCSLWWVLRSEPNWQLSMEGHWVDIFGTNNWKTNIKKVLLAVFAPWFLLGVISSKLHNKRMLKDYIFPAVLIYLWLLLQILSIGYTNVDRIGWSCLIIFACYAARIRQKVRDKFGIDGNIIFDIFAMLIYPLSILQMHKEITSPLKQTNAEVIENRNGARIYEDVADIVHPDVEVNTPC